MMRNDRFGAIITAGVKFSLISISCKRLHWNKYKSVNAATMLNYSLLNKIYVVVLVPSHGNCAYQEGTALPLMPCLCRSFSAQLSSSSAWGAIDKHPRLCNTPLTAPDWAHFLTYLGWGLKFSPQSSAEGGKKHTSEHALLPTSNWRNMNELRQGTCL